LTQKNFTRDARKMLGEGDKCIVRNSDSLADLMRIMASRPYSLKETDKPAGAAGALL